MAAARLEVAAAAAVLVAAALPLLAAGAYADCYDFCFKDCISKDKSMRDYCSYACDKTCAPDAALRRRPVAAADVGGLAIACQTNCVRASCHGVRAEGKDMVDCYGQCYDRCNTGSLPRPLRAGTGAVQPAAMPDQPSHEKQDAVGPAALPGAPFHEKQDGVGPAALPDQAFHEKQDGVGPAALPDHAFHEKQDGVGPAALPDHPFHEKQDAVWPAALPDHPFHEKQDGVGPAAPFHEKQEAVQPTGEPDPDDASHQAWGKVLP